MKKNNLILDWWMYSMHGLCHPGQHNPHNHWPQVRAQNESTGHWL